MRGRTDGHPIARQIEPRVPARGGDVRKAPVDESWIEMLKGQVYGTSGPFDFSRDCPRYSIPRREVA
jgi:hypothetical protein